MLGCVWARESYGSGARTERSGSGLTSSSCLTLGTHHKAQCLLRSCGNRVSQSSRINTVRYAGASFVELRVLPKTDV